MNSLFRNKLNPHTDSHGLMMHEFVAILSITGDMTALEILVGLFGFEIARKPDTHAKNLMTAVLAADREHGDIARVLQESLADGRLNTRERLAIRREIGESRRALDALEERVMDEHEGGI